MTLARRSIVGGIQGPLRLSRELFGTARNDVSRRRLSLRSRGFNVELTLQQACEAHPDPTDLHLYMHHYFHRRAPQLLREHRAYFRKGKRGFGEDAFHAMWLHLFLQHRPCRVLEIGVYRGQIVTLWGVLAKYLHYSCEIHGISPLEPIGDEVSAYPSSNYRRDITEACTHFRVPPITLVKSLSTDPLAIAHIGQRQWDLIYIDGSHDFDTVLADYRLARDHLAPGGVLVLDDAAFGTAYRPPRFSFAGHPGPSRVAAKYAAHEMTHIASVGHNVIFQAAAPSSVLPGSPA